MKKIKEFLKNHKEYEKSFEELSVTDQGETFVSDKTLAYDYDKLIKELGKQSFCTADALLVKDDTIIFVEFKNRKMKITGKGCIKNLTNKNLCYNVRLKALESVFAFGTLLYDNIIIRELNDVYNLKMKYILVYSSHKNQTLRNNEINIEMRRRYESKVIFELERYENILYEKVLTISDIKFEEMIKKKL